MGMSSTGLVYVPSEGPRGWQGEPPGLQLVVNRTIVCHILESLAADPARSLAVLAAPEQLPELRAAVAADPVLTAEPDWIALEGRRDLEGALQAAVGFVDDASAVLHLATGLLAQPLDPLLTIGDGAAPDLLLFLHRGDGCATLDMTTERLLGVSDLAEDGPRLGIAEVAVFGPGGVGRAARALADAGRPTTSEDENAHPLVAVAERLAASGLGVAAGIVRGWCAYSCAPADLLELNRSVLDRQVAQIGPPAGTDNRIEGRVVIDPTADVSSSVILGPCLIGAGARVADSYVGPYTTIGADSVLEGTEIVRSVVAEGARITYVGGRIEGSTIGPGAHIFRDFTLPRAMRLHVGENVEVALD